VGRSYFVQTPCRTFPIESHSWLPLAGQLPRWALLPTLRVSNKVWVKKTVPDWNLLSGKQMSGLFPEAALIEERRFGFCKSIMAIKE